MSVLPLSTELKQNKQDSENISLINFSIITPTCNLKKSTYKGVQTFHPLSVIGTINSRKNLSLAFIGRRIVTGFLYRVEHEFFAGHVYYDNNIVNNERSLIRAPSFLC